jgi:putative hemolysin
MEILVLALLILINGFFALSEIALVSSRKPRLEQFRIKGSKGAKTALKLLASSENFLSSIQVGITLIGIITGVYGGMNLADDVAPFFLKFEFSALYAHEIALTLTVVIITFFAIVIGELVPKTIALSNPERIAIRVAPAIWWFSTIFYPFVKLLSVSTNLINRILGIKQRPEYISEAELRQLLKTASHEGVIEKEQNLIHERVFYFSDKKAKHIMTHRTEVDWADIGKSETDFLEAVLASKHSKIVVGRQTPDEFLGILPVKEYFMKLNTGEKFKIADLLFEPIIIPENTSAQKVLDLFKKKQNYFAVIVNEYGSFEGIITLHDIIENLVGEIPDEGETEEPDIFVRDDHSVLVSGDAPIETLSQVIEDFIIDFDQIDYSTVAGFVLANINKIPQVGDKFDFANYIIEIVDIDGNKIDKILITHKSPK